MRSKTVVCALLALAACGRGTAAGRDSAADSNAARIDARATTAAGTILFIGTSLTAGLGLAPEQAFPALIQERIDSAGLNYTVVNAGVSGETSAGARRRIDWLMRQPVDVVVLETGANDGLRGLGVDSMRANIQAIIDRITQRQPRARILLVAMEALPNLGPRYTSEFRRVFPELAAANGVTLVPFLLEGVAGTAGLNQADGIHPNAAGARILADNVWRVLGGVLADARLDSTGRRD
jgi:acyl-CoA thioesterase-1